MLQEINTKYVTTLKKYESKANVCSYKIKLTNNVNFLVILMFPDLEYLKQSFLETLSVFVLNLKNNSFTKS